MLPYNRRGDVLLAHSDSYVVCERAVYAVHSEAAQQHQQFKRLYSVAVTVGDLVGLRGVTVEPLDKKKIANYTKNRILFSMELSWLSVWSIYSSSSSFNALR